MGNPRESSGLKPEPLIVSRTFPAPRELVFSAWSRADHIKRWFSPEGCSVPDSRGRLQSRRRLCCLHAAARRVDHWARGTFLEISPPERLVLSIGVEVGGLERFTAHTDVTFETEGAGTRMTVRQSYEFRDPAFVDAASGASEGWRATLDKLEKEVVRMQAPPPRSVVHGVFTVGRSYAASPAQVYRALSDKEAKARWFGGHEGFVALEREMDVRAGRARAFEGPLAQRFGHDVRRGLFRHRRR